MSKKTITLYHLYPDLLNLHADFGNVAVIKMRCEKRGIEFILKTLAIDESADFCDADIIMLGGGSPKELRKVSEQKRVIADALKNYVQSDGIVFASCEGYQLLGNFYESDGEKIEGFGILDIETAYSEERLMSNAIIETTLGDRSVIITGFENHTGRTNIKNHKPFGRVLSGYGNDGSREFEGVIYKNTIATYLCGPLLPQNPEFADYLIETALKRKGAMGEQGLDILDDTIEMRAKNFMIERENKQKN